MSGEVFTRAQDFYEERYGGADPTSASNSVLFSDGQASRFPLSVDEELLDFSSFRRNCKRTYKTWLAHSMRDPLTHLVNERVHTQARSSNGFSSPVKCKRGWVCVYAGHTSCASHFNFSGCCEFYLNHQVVC